VSQCDSALLARIKSELLLWGGLCAQVDLEDVEVGKNHIIRDLEAARLLIYDALIALVVTLPKRENVADVL